MYLNTWPKSNQTSIAPSTSAQVILLGIAKHWGTTLKSSLIKANTESPWEAREGEKRDDGKPKDKSDRYELTDNEDMSITKKATKKACVLPLSTIV